jgi:adenosylmethionine-8-amino-7-oxononanoate aminotransferase
MCHYDQNRLTRGRAKVILDACFVGERRHVGRMSPDGRRVPATSDRSELYPHLGPLGRMPDNYAQRDLAHLIHPLARIQQLNDNGGPAVVVSGDGAEVLLSDGRTMIDGPSGMWCVNVGHGRRELLDAAVRQMEQIAFSPIFGAHSTPAAIEFCELLSSIAPGDLDHVFLVNGGSEANETAIKLARYHWHLKGRSEKTLILSHDRGYHGVTGTVTYATGLAPYHVGFGPPPRTVGHFPSPYDYQIADEERFEWIASGRALEAAILEHGADSVAAIIVEPVIGSGGVLVPPDGYLRRLQEVCRRHDVLMIADEIITGFGRTGTWFAVEHDNVVPDLLTFAKGVSSGYIPLGGVLVGGSVWEALRTAEGDPQLWHGFTTSGHPVACAVASANIRLIRDEQLIERVVDQGAYLAELLEGLRELPEVGDVRYRGLMASVELVMDQDTREKFPPEETRGARVALAARDHGLLVRPLIGDIIFLAPPFVITREQLERMVAAIRQAIIDTRAAVGVGARG